MSLSRRTFIQLAAGAAAAGLNGCVSTNPATGRQSFTGLYSPADDIRLGREQHPKILEAFGGEYSDRRLNAYIDAIGRRLAAYTEYQQFPYRFTLLNSPIVNAFALPGGYVYISRGLLALAGSEAELAGVLGHELGHINARHTSERMSATQVAQLGVLAGALGASLLGLPGGTVARIGSQIAELSIRSYSRSQELEADRLGVRYMSRAGYAADAMVEFLSSLHRQSQLEARALGLPPGKVDQYNMLATHPRTLDRVRQAQAEANVRHPAQARLGREEYLRRLDRLLFGDDPSEGIVRGRRFVHPRLRFEFTVPANFRIDNAADKVTARDAGGALIVFDLAPIRRARDMRTYLRREWAPKASLRELESLRINGHAAATASTLVRTRSGVVSLRLVALRRDAGSSYRLLFAAPQQRARGLDEAFRRTAWSFRTLGAEEAGAIAPLRLYTRAAVPGDRVERLAAPLPYGKLNPEWFRMFNHLKPGQQPPSGKLLKVFHA